MIKVGTGEVFHGAQGLRTYLERWTTAFPDAKVEIDRITAGPDG